MLYNFIVAFSFLLIATFSYWYSSKLANYKKTSFLMSFFVVLIPYTLAGGLKMITEKYISHYSLLVMFVALIILQTYFGYLMFKEPMKKTVIASILGLVVTIIIGLPILVLAGIAITYLNLKTPQ
ncbi:competence protein comp [Sulfurihydrogenibium sp.]|uniref:competence protein comp n=1 Tax=Sulfurihydrogenibium sp. TaxID=2053621 RepID=UPI0026066B6C|nr:competence protein comp [Sulfurihydrogenibium sp.]